MKLSKVLEGGKMKTYIIELFTSEEEYDLELVEIECKSIEQDGKWSLILDGCIRIAFERGIVDDIRLK